MSGQDEIDRSEQRAVDAEAREAASSEVSDALQAASDVREAASIVREGEAVAREAESVSREAAMASVLPGIQEALTGLNNTMAALIERLDAVAQTSDEIGKWRRRATWALRGVVAALLAVVVAGAVISALIYRDGVERSDDAARTVSEQARISAEARQANCQAVEVAFDKYTDLLIEALAPSDVVRPPDVQAEIDKGAAEFRLAVQDELGKCA